MRLDFAPPAGDLVVGNAARDGAGANRRGWFLGHFVSPADRLQHTLDLEVKWGVHRAGDRKTAARNDRARTLSILVSGRFLIEFPTAARTVWLTAPGDYALWSGGLMHGWVSVEDSVILTVRWPSIAGDQRPADGGLKS